MKKSITEAKAKKPKKRESKPKIPRLKRTEKTTIDVQHDFTPPERLDLSAKLNTLLNTHDTVEEAMKSIQAEYKAKLKVIEAEIQQVRGKINSGHEFRPTAVIVHFNKPKKGLKRIVRADNKVLVRDEIMSPADLHSELFNKRQLEETRKPEPPATGKDNPADPGWSAAGKATEEKPLNAPVVPDGEGKTSTAAVS